MPTNDDILLEEALAQKPMGAGTFWRLASYVRPYRRTLLLNLLRMEHVTASERASTLHGMPGGSRTPGWLGSAAHPSRF